MKYHVDLKIKKDGETSNRSLGDYNAEKQLTAGELKTLVKSQLDYPFTIEKEELFLLNKEIKDDAEIIDERISGVQYIIYYKTKKH